MSKLALKLEITKIVKVKQTFIIRGDNLNELQDYGLGILKNPELYERFLTLQEEEKPKIAKYNGLIVDNKGTLLSTINS